MIQCRDPKITKSGLVVPCGKCELCKSKRRNDWSIRLAVETKYSDRMPLFITLTYDDLHLPYVCLCDSELSHGKVFTLENEEFAKRCHNHVSTLYRPDVSAFLKEYKRVNKYDSDTFHYFGCGEYGDQFGRPHYHLLFFGDDVLYDLYDESVDKAVEYIQSFWKYGLVHVCLAGFDGIHYVTKYCLKDDVQNLVYEQQEPFTICSKNLGASYFQTRECFILKRKIDYLYNHRDEIYEKVGSIRLDKGYLGNLISELRYYFPEFVTVLDDGRKVFLPRYFRRKILGSFEHFKDNPLWLFDWIQKLYDSVSYYEMFGEYDRSHKMTAAMQSTLVRIDKINKRLKQRKHEKIKFRKNEGI